MAERWLSVEEISAHLDVSPDTLYKWGYRNKVPAHKVGRLWKFLASELDDRIKTGDAAKDVAPAPPGPTPKPRSSRHGRKGTAP